MLCFLKVVTESQISWGWKGHLEFTWLNPLLRQGHQEPVAQDQVQKAFEYLPGITSTSYICGSVCNRKLDLSVCCSMATHLIWPTLWVTISSCIFLWLQILCNSKGEYFCSFISQVNTDRRSKHCCTEPSLETTAHSHVDSFTNPPPTFPQQVLRVHTCFHSTNHLPWLYCQKKKKKKNRSKCDSLWYTAVTLQNCIDQLNLQNLQQLCFLTAPATHPQKPMVILASNCSELSLAHS